MNNYEKYKNKLDTITDKVGIYKGQPTRCKNIPCSECDLHNYHGEDCCIEFVKWLMKESK